MDALPLRCQAWDTSGVARAGAEIDECAATDDLRQRVWVVRQSRVLPVGRGPGRLTRRTP
jgi:hypothetical protein